MKRFLLCIAMCLFGVFSTPALAQSIQLNTLSKRIVFASDRDADFEIYLLDNDGKIFAQLTDNHATDLAPSWSPDGNSIVFASNIDGDFDIYRLDIQSGETVNLTNNQADDLYPVWSPDGKTIAFTSNRSLNWDIYTMGVDGNNVKQLTKDKIYEGNAAWSPDSKRLVFVVNRDKKQDIYVMDADGANRLPLTTRPTSADFSPAWSPDGKRIAFVSNRSGNPDIFVVDISCIGKPEVCDRNAIDLTSDSRNGDLDPTWSPDSKQILFASGRKDEPTLYVMNDDGSDVHPIFNEDNKISCDRFPAWWAEH